MFCLGIKYLFLTMIGESICNFYVMCFFWIFGWCSVFLNWNETTIKNRDCFFILLEVKLTKWQLTNSAGDQIIFHSTVDSLWCFPSYSLKSKIKVLDIWQLVNFADGHRTYFQSFLGVPSFLSRPISLVFSSSLESQFKSNIWDFLWLIFSKCLFIITFVKFFFL